MNREGDQLKSDELLALVEDYMEVVAHTVSMAITTFCLWSIAPVTCNKAEGNNTMKLF